MAKPLDLNEQIQKQHVRKIHKKKAKSWLLARGCLNNDWKNIYISCHFYGTEPSKQHAETNITNIYQYKQSFLTSNMCWKKNGSWYETSFSHEKSSKDYHNFPLKRNISSDIVVRAKI